MRADKARPVTGGSGAPIRTQDSPAAAWRRQSSPCGLTAGARPLTSRCADGAPAALALPGGTDGRGARSALHRHRPEFRFHAIEQQRGSGLCHAVERGHRRHKGRLRAIGQLCCLLARCVLYLRRCRSAGDDRPRSRPAVLRGPSAARPCRSPPLIRALHVENRGWHHHGRERGPAALAGRAEARGSEKERASATMLAVSAISEGDSFFRRQALPHMRKAAQQPTNTSPSRPKTVRASNEI